MAVIDPERERVVLRIVYDGPALAGKTTSLKSLAEMFGRPVFTSEGADGRTLYFDWMEYQGGRFEQLAVCCQVVTVPGQEALAHRRFALLASADVVIFVLDARERELENSLRSFQALRAYLATRPEPRPGVLLQANKRDLPGAASLETIRRELALGATVGVTESVAVDGTGVRQTFVFAVRLALDRVAELMRHGELPRGQPAIDNGPALLAELERLEGRERREERRQGRQPPAEAAGQQSAEPKEAAPVTADGPQLPGANIPTGCVWPPIEGRLVLHEAAAEGVALGRSPSGDWRGVAGSWLIHSAAAGEYASGEDGRAALMEWARWHAALGRHLSPRRCVALGDGSGGTHRLWQVVRREVTLGQRLTRAIRAREPDAAARAMLQAAEALREIYATVAPTGLKISLETVGLLDAGPAYVAWAPTPRGLELKPNGFAPLPLDLRASFAPWLEREMKALEPQIEAVRGRLERVALALGQEETGQMLAGLLAARTWRGGASA